MKAIVTVRLKPSVHDPQGKAIKKALGQLDFPQIASVRQGKLFELTLDVNSRKEAETLVRRIADRVLSNPVLEVFDFDLIE